jgi:hypothetical protein
MDTAAIPRKRGRVRWDKHGEIRRIGAEEEMSTLPEGT